MELDKDNIPERIYWDGDQKETPGYSETKSISISLWEAENKNTKCSFPAFPSAHHLIGVSSS